MRPLPGARIGQSHRLHRTEGEGVAAALGHHLDGKAPFEVPRFLERMWRDLLPAQQLVDETLVLVARQRKIQVIGAFALPVPRLGEGDGAVHRVAGHDRSDGVVERELRSANRLREGTRELLSGERAGGDDAKIWRRGEVAHFAGSDAEARMLAHLRRQA